MKYLSFIPVYIFGLIILPGCQRQPRRLPFLGEPVISQQIKDGTRETDTTYPQIAGFSLIDQDSNAVTNRTFADKIYVADFIFLSCPTICPKMTREMQKLYLKYAGDSRVSLLSHTLDPQHDTVARLRNYTHELGVSSRKWHFVTGNEDSIINLARRSYYATAYPDSTDPGNFVHSGGLLLVDRNRHVRGVYNGTDPVETERLIGDIQILLNEQF